MPYVHIQITREGATAEQKAELIRGTTDLLVRVLDKNPATTFVLIEEVDTDHWGIGGETVTVLRQRARAAEAAAGRRFRQRPIPALGAWPEPYFKPSARSTRAPYR